MSRTDERGEHQQRFDIVVAEHEWSPEWFGRDPIEWADELLRKRLRLDIGTGPSQLDVAIEVSAVGAHASWTDARTNRVRSGTPGGE